MIHWWGFLMYVALNFYVGWMFFAHGRPQRRSRPAPAPSPAPAEPSCSHPSVVPVVLATGETVNYLCQSCLAEVDLSGLKVGVASLACTEDNREEFRRKLRAQLGVDNLLASAPGTFETLREIADQQEPQQ